MARPRPVEEKTPPLDPEFGIMFLLETEEDVEKWLAANVEEAAMSEPHAIDLGEGIDEIDEISGDEQLALVWCTIHRAWEWHWIPVER
jgi:hypothetical protein